MVQPDIVKMGASPGLRSAPRSAMRTMSNSSRTRRSRPSGDAANMRLMTTVMHLAKPVEVADNPRCLDALFNQSCRTAHSRCRRVRVLARPREARAAHQAALMPPVTDLRPLRHGMARRSGVHRTTVTAGPRTTRIADATHLGIRNEATELEQRHGPTDRNTCALRR